MEIQDAAMLLLRVWMGLVMVFHGVNHGRTLEGTANWFARVGFRAPGLNARLSAYAEVLIGVGIATGTLTSFAAAGLVATMFVAFWSIHRFSGFFNFHRPDEGYEYVTTLAIAGLVLAMLGPGAYSVDAAVGVAGHFDGSTGGLIALGGIAVGVGQAALFWRRPGETT